MMLVLKGLKINYKIYQLLISKYKLSLWKNENGLKNVQSKRIILFKGLDGG